MRSSIINISSRTPVDFLLLWLCLLVLFREGFYLLLEYLCSNAHLLTLSFVMCSQVFFLLMISLSFDFLFGSIIRSSTCCFQIDGFSSRFLYVFRSSSRFLASRFRVQLCLLSLSLYSQ